MYGCFVVVFETTFQPARAALQPAAGTAHRRGTRARLEGRLETAAGSPLSTSVSETIHHEPRRRLALADAFLQGLSETAEQLSDLEKWCRILSRALIKYLHGRVIRPPPGYLPA